MKRRDCNAESRVSQETRASFTLSPTAVAQEICDAVDIQSPARNHQSNIRSGHLVVDLETRVVTADGKPVQLTGKEYSILELLSLRQGVTVTKAMLIGHLYGGQHEPELKIIDVFVSHLHKKLTRATNMSRPFALRLSTLGSSGNTAATLSLTTSVGERNL